jgi:hypothetical protein
VLFKHFQTHSNRVTLYFTMDRESPVQDSLMREGSSPPSPTSPILFAPFRNRSRMLTEETIWMQNGTSYQYPNMTDANPFTSRDEMDDDAHDDDRSAVSSLSNDSRRRMSPGWDSEGPPPTEIDVHILITTEVPDWLKETESSSSSATDDPPPPPPPPHLTPIWTGGASPADVRPTMGRNRSSPMSHNLPTGRPTTVPRVLTFSKIHDSSTIVGGSSNLSKGSVLSSQEDVSLLGNRPRRRHHRHPSLTVSVGSLVGQSSFVTAPSATATATSSSFSDQSWQHQLNAQRALDHLVGDVTTSATIRTRRNPVKEEIKYVWGRVSTPIRRLTGTDETVKLKRASGCLT